MPPSDTKNLRQPIEQGTKPKPIEPARCRAVISTTSFNTISAVFIDHVTIGIGPRRVKTFQLAIVGREQFEPGANISTRVIGNNGLVALVAFVQSVGDVVADVVLADVFSSEEESQSL